MKSLLKKFHKALTVVMCLALVVETINLTSISAFAAGESSAVTTSGNDVSGGSTVSSNTVSGNEVSGNDISGNTVSGNTVSGNGVSAETQKAEDDLAALAQNAVSATQYQLDIAKKFEVSASEHAGRAQTSYQKVVAAAGLNYALIDIKNSVSKFAGYAQGAENRCLQAYETAKSDLAKWTAKVDEALAKAKAADDTVTGETAKAVLAQAQANVDAAKQAYENAKKDADEANTLILLVQEAYDSKEVVASFFVLNRGLEQPEEISKQPSANYSKAVIGKLYSGVENEGVRDDSYLILYHNGILTDIDSYFAEAAPTAADFGIDIAENEEIVWYVIKTDNGYIHVNGIIKEKAPVVNPEEENPAGGAPAGNTPAGNTPAGNNPALENTPAENPVVDNPQTNVPAAPVVNETEDVDDAGVTETVSADEVVEIEEEKTALAAGAEEGDGAQVDIEDEEVPLAAHNSCYIHWIILIVTLLYTIFELIRGISRGKRINELKEEAEKEMA